MLKMYLKRGKQNPKSQHKTLAHLGLLPKCLVSQLVADFVIRESTNIFILTAALVPADSM